VIPGDSFIVASSSFLKRFPDKTLIAFCCQLTKDGEKLRGSQGDAPLGLLPPLGEREGHSHYFSKTGSTRIFDKTLNNSILHMSRIVDFPVQQDAVVNEG
jgi:hypothetical protein